MRLVWRITDIGPVVDAGQLEQNLHGGGGQPGAVYLESPDDITAEQKRVPPNLRSAEGDQDAASSSAFSVLALERLRIQLKQMARIRAKPT